MPIRNCREPWLSRGRLDSLYQMVHWLVLVCFKQANGIFVLSRMVQMAQHSTANIAILLSSKPFAGCTTRQGLDANHCLSQSSEESGSISRDHTSFSSALPSMLL